MVSTKMYLYLHVWRLVRGGGLLMAACEPASLLGPYRVLSENSPAIKGDCDGALRRSELGIRD